MREGILEYGKNYPEWGQRMSELGMKGTEAGASVGGTAINAGQGVSDIYGDVAKTNLSAGELANQTYRTGADMMGTAAPYYNASRGAGASAMQGTNAAIDDQYRADERWDPLAQDIGQGASEAVGNWFKTSNSTNAAPTTTGPRPLGTSPTTPNPIKGYAGGGEVEGPGGPYSDQVPIKASDGEFVIPYEVVHRLGTKHFENMVNKTRQELQALPT